MKELRNKGSYLKYFIEEDSQDFIEIRQIFVEPGERQHGVGTELLEELKKIAIKLGKKRIVTYSSTDPEMQTFGKFLVANNFVKQNTHNNYGYLWELKIYDDTRRMEK